MDFSGATWRKSSRSGSAEDDNCVEVAFSAGAIAVRDSKNLAGGQLIFGGRPWGVFAASMRSREARPATS